MTAWTRVSPRKVFSCSFAMKRSVPTSVRLADRVRAEISGSFSSATFHHRQDSPDLVTSRRCFLHRRHTR